MTERRHTSAEELRRFEALSDTEKLREIWLNGRETNGRVGILEQRANAQEAQSAEHDQRLVSVEHWQLKAAALLAAALILAPLVFYGMLRVWEG